MKGTAAGIYNVTENNPSTTATIFCNEPAVANHLLLESTKNIHLDNIHG